MRFNLYDVICHKKGNVEYLVTGIGNEALIQINFEKSWVYAQNYRFIKKGKREPQLEFSF